MHARSSLSVVSQVSTRAGVDQRVRPPGTARRVDRLRAVENGHATPGSTTRAALSGKCETRIRFPESRNGLCLQPSGFRRGAKCCMGAPRDANFLFARLGAGGTHRRGVAARRGVVDRRVALLGKREQVLVGPPWQGQVLKGFLGRSQGDAFDAAERERESRTRGGGAAGGGRDG